ncbi:MAG: hypothetical protein K0U66_06010 [Gammaproteobacteria bacterium]|nr:hypothetical protein [Gammaproteobacteria bacterium]
MTTPLGGILVTGLYFAFTIVLWVGLNPRTRKASGRAASAIPAQAAKTVDHSTTTDEASPGTGALNANTTTIRLSEADATAVDGRESEAGATAVDGRVGAGNGHGGGLRLAQVAGGHEEVGGGYEEVGGGREDGLRLVPVLFLFWVAAAAHAVYTAIDLLHAFPDASVSKAFSLTALLMMVFVLGLCARFSLHILLLFFAPLAGMAVLLSAFDQTPAAPFSTEPLVYWHLICGLTGASLCLMSLPLAASAQYLSRQLRFGADSEWFMLLPPLASIEKLIINLLVAATALLLLAIALIIPAVNDIGEQHLTHKIFFSVVALAILTTVLAGRWYSGWRGTRLVIMVYAANASLILAYFGTKTVLELILQ